MKKLLTILIWILLPVLLFIGIYASLDQMPPNPNSYNPGLPHNPVTTWAHVVPGLLFMILGPIQFIPFVRKTWPGYHRFAGKVFIICCYFLGITALIIAIGFPYAKFDDRVSVISQQIPNILFALLFMYFVTMAYVRIRKGMVSAHQRFMIRTFSIGMGISVFRVLIIVFALLGVSPFQFIALLFWAGFLSAWGIGELYIFLHRI